MLTIEQKKGMSVVLILAICVANIFSHMPVSAAEAKRITMTSLFNDGDYLPVKEGDTVTIESLEEWNMFAQYAPNDIYYMRGVTVELLNDIRVTPYTFSYDEETMRIGISWYDSLEAAYDVNSEGYYENFDSEQVINYRWHGTTLFTVEHFNGIFDGNGNYIIGAYNDQNYTTGGMLFSEIENGQVRNLNLSHFFLKDKYISCSALCGMFSGEIINCHGSDLYLFGISGLVRMIPEQCKVSVADCSAEVHMFPRDGHSNNYGGIIGNVELGSEVMVERSYSSGLIYGKSIGCVGGILGGFSYAGSIVEIRNCVSEVNIAGEFDGAGGIAGSEVTYLFNCENKGDISISGGRAGGLLGYENRYRYLGIRVIDQCRNTGKISSSHIAGGIVGTAQKIEIKNTENVGDVCFEDCEGGEDVSKQNQGGIGGIVGRVERLSGSASGVVIKNSFCSGNVMGGKKHAGGLIGAIGAEKSFLEIDNVCFYGEVETEKEAGIILGKVNTTSVESLSAEEVQNVYYHEQKTSSTSGDGTEIPAYMYPVSEVQMSGAEEDTCIGQGDFAQTPSLCDALNSWCRAQDDSEGMVGWKQGKFPVLEIDDETKPEKPKPVVLPAFTPTPVPTEEPTSVPTASPTQSPTEEPTSVPTISPTQSPTEEPTSVPTASLTQSPTKEPTSVPTVSPSQNPVEEPTLIPIPTGTSTQPPADNGTFLAVTAPPPAVPTVSALHSAVPAVTSIVVTPEKNASVRIRWNTLTKVSGYTVYRSKKKTSGYRVIANVPGAKTEWRDKSVKEKCTYFYRVAAYQVVQGKKIYGTCECRSAKIKVKLRAPVLTVKKKISAHGQHYIQIKIKKYRASGVELWGKTGKGSFRRISLKGVKVKKKTNVINLSYGLKKQTFYIRARIYQGKKKRYKSYYSKAKRIRL